MSLAIGVDVGGSKIAACVVDTDRGDVLRSQRVPTRPERGGAAVLTDCVAVVHELGAEAPVGIAICELVSPDGSIASAATVDWLGVDIAAAFAPLPVVVESDVRAAALAEARFGAGAGHRSFVYLSVGTGIAATLVLDGAPYAGARGNALVLGAPPVEGTASGAAIAAAGRAASAEEVFASPAGAAIVARAADELGRAMAWLVNAFDPEVLVVGGGLGLRHDYRDAATTVMRRHVWAEAGRELPVVPAALGAAAGAIGAAVAALRQTL